MFLWLTSAEFNNHEIYPKLWFSSDYTLLTINIIIKKEFILRRKHTIIKNSKEKSEFIEDLTRRFRNIGMMLITDKAYLLQTQVLRVGQVNEPYIGLIQENLIENSVQDSLPYILKSHHLC